MEKRTSGVMTGRLEGRGRKSRGGSLLTLVACCLLASTARGRVETEEQERVIAAVEELDGKVIRDETRPEKPVVTILLSGNQVTDSTLPPLKCLTSLQSLDLSDTRVTDAGLVHLKGLTGLEGLSLRNALLTNIGLAQLLKDMTSLRQLDLSQTHATDSTLSHLKGLTGLQFLSLSDTRVTDAGVHDLQLALPKAEIRH